VLEGVGSRLSRNGRFVLTRPSRDLTDVIPVDFEVAKVLAYGDTRILVCREGR
jgi:hypothetical protein